MPEVGWRQSKPVSGLTPARANKMTSAQRKECLKKAMSIIYGSAQAPKAIGSRH